jgi:hypothetical protein
MPDTHFCHDYQPHTPDHDPTVHGEEGYCKVCLEYDFVAEAVAVNISGPGGFLVVKPVRWTPCASALEIEARKRLAGMLPAAPPPATTQQDTTPLHPNEWAILKVLAVQPQVAMTQADVGEQTDPRMSPQTVMRWLKKLRKHGLTEPLTSGVESITAKGLSLVLGK